MTTIGIALTIGGACLQLVLLAILLRRKLHREFLFFVCYIIAAVLIALIRFSSHHDIKQYFYVYWATEAVYTVLGVLVLHQVFRRVFEEFYSYWSWFWLLFPAVASAVTLVAVWYGIEYSPKQRFLATKVILIAGIAVNVMQTGLFGLFFLLVKFFALRWRNYAFAIVLGFAVAAMGTWTGFWVRTHYGTQFETFSIYAPSVSYLCAVLLWLAVFNRPEPDTSWALTVTPEELLQELREYGKILAAIRRR